MKRLGLVFLIAIPFLVVRSEEPVPQGFEHWTPANLQHAAQALGAEAATDPHHFAVKQLSDFPSEAFLLVHREADGQVEWHETQVDVFFVQSGSATLVAGGTYQGGSRQKLSAGDVVRIPARVPHQLVLDGAHEFTYFVIKVKGY